MEDKNLRFNPCLFNLIMNKDLPILCIVTSQYLSGTREAIIVVGIGIGVGIVVGIVVVDTGHYT